MGGDGEDCCIFGIELRWLDLVGVKLVWKGMNSSLDLESSTRGARCDREGPALAFLFKRGAGVALLSEEAGLRVWNLDLDGEPGVLSSTEVGRLRTDLTNASWDKKAVRAT